jgi:predicted transcriptional regulator
MVLMRPAHSLNLGDLEMQVLEQLWALGSGDVRAVHQAIESSRDIHSNTVQSAMERLYRKGLLTREKTSHAYVYEPQISREDLAARLIEETLGRMSPAEPLPLLAAFVDLSLQRHDLGTLEELERLVAERRANLRKAPK